MPITDSFGFLPVNRLIKFDEGSFAPLVDLAAKIKAVTAATHPDGHYYPPQQVTVSQRMVPQADAPDSEKEVPGSRRAAFLYKLPTSHTVTLDAAPVGSDFRMGDGAFLIYFLGHMFCYRLQFKDWWHDARLPMQGRQWSLLRQSDERAILSTAYHTWKTWPEAERVRFTNLLYMHVRSFSYEWDWERFTLRYMVFDGCYRTAQALDLVADVGHKRGMEAMLRHFEMPTDPVIVKKLVDLRNDLFHEALWDRGQPGTASREGFALADSLWRINDRFLFALTGYRGPYLTIPWWDIGQALM